MNIKRFKGREGVSEVIGTVLLLGIAVIIFSSLIVYVLSMDTGNPSPDVHMVGYMNEYGHAIVEHRGGDPLPIEDLKVTIWKGTDASKSFEGSELAAIFRDSNNNAIWDVGDYIDINCPQIFGGVAHWQVSVALVDKVSNSIIMSGVVQTGHTEYLFTDESEIDGAADFTWNPEPACVRDAIAFNPSSSAHSSYIVSYYWTFGDGTPASTLAEPDHQYATPGTYTVTLNITYAPGVNVSGVRNWDTVTKQVTVSDIPHITDNSPHPATTGDPYTFSVSVTDLDGIDSVFVRYRFGSGATTNVSMTNVGGSTWEHTITIPATSLNDLYYSIAANDTLGFWNSTGTLTTDVVDNDPPSIVNDSPSNGTTGDPYTFRVNVTDNINSGSDIVVTADWSHGSLSGNTSLSYVSGTMYEGTITLDLYSTANLAYDLYAEDAAGNGNTTGPFSATVADNDPPAITDHSDQWAFWDEDFVFNASVTDNIAVANVYLEYWIDGGTPTNVSLTNVGGSYYQYTKHLPISGTTLYYVFATVDTSGNWADYFEYNKTLYSGHVHNVNQGTWYDQIYQATKVANPGDEIRIYPGTYDTHGQGNKNIVIDQDDVKLVGRSSPDTVLMISQQDGITVTASNVLIKNLTMVKNSNAQPSNSFKKGIYVNGATNVTIDNVDISEAGQSAIYITGSTQVTVVNSKLWNNQQHGVYVGGDSTNVYIENNNIFDNDESGVLIEDSDGNTVVGNNIYHNADGVYLYRATYCNVSSNTIWGNDAGVTLQGTNQEDTKLNIVYSNVINHSNIGIEFVEYARQNNLTYNTLHNNTQYGIYIPAPNNKENNNNQLDHNNFMDNGLSNAYDECNNIWDDGSQGNYWDDYTGSDTNGDGIGDTNIPHNIVGGPNTDPYPFVNPV